MMDLRSTLTDRLDIEWLACNVHPWYRRRGKHRPFTIQCLAGADAEVDRPFAELPEVNMIQPGFLTQSQAT